MLLQCSSLSYVIKGITSCTFDGFSILGCQLEIIEIDLENEWKEMNSDVSTKSFNQYRKFETQKVLSFLWNKELLYKYRDFGQF